MGGSPRDSEGLHTVLWVDRVAWSNAGRLLMSPPHDSLTHPMTRILFAAVTFEDAHGRLIID